MDHIEAATQIAKEAGRIQMDALRSDINVEYKGTIDIVTDIDKKCEKLIVDFLSKNFPTYSVLGEEGTKKDGSEWKWIIDPIDGTTNFARGFPVFATSIALAKNDEVVAGVVFDPNRNELFSAEKGSGAFLNGKKMCVTQENKLIKSLLATGFAYNVRETKEINNMELFTRFIMTTRAIRRMGSAALDLCYVACGRLDGYWRSLLEAWDIAAGSLLVSEAGGMVTMYDGSHFDVYGKDLVASNRHLHSEMLRVIGAIKKNEAVNE